MKAPNYLVEAHDEDAFLKREATDIQIWCQYLSDVQDALKSLLPEHEVVVITKIEEKSDG